jgi:hypothetical protein
MSNITLYPERLDRERYEAELNAWLDEMQWLDAMREADAYRALTQ